MAVASLVGLGHAGDKNLNEIYDTATGILVDHGIDFGAHSDNLAHGDFSGCGAIDKAPEIISNVTKYQTQISDTVSALGLDPSGLEDVIRNFSQYSERNISTDYRGADIVENIRRQGRVVKELKDGHNEMYIVLNNVRGKTVNQKKVRDVSDNKVQTFAIDIWRLEDSVEAMYPEEKGFRASDRQKALLAELAYSLATAATLTKGDLPVYITIGQTQAVTV